MTDFITSQQAKSLLQEDFDYIFGDKHKFATPLKLHQSASILWAMFQDRVLFLHGIGTGKTLAALYMTAVWYADRVLVVCPSTVCQTWVDEIKKRTDLCCAVLRGDANMRKHIMETDFSRFHIINYEGLKSIYGKKVPVMKKGKVVKHKYVPDHKKIAQSHYDCLIFDEFHRLKAFQTRQAQISYELSRQATKVLMMSGTPVAKDIRDFWSELMILDNGATLGNDEMVFLHTYMNRVEIRTKTHRFFEWYPKKGAADKVVKKVSQVAIRYDASECLDLPELVDEKRYIDVSAEQRKITKSILNGLKVELEEGKLTIRNAVNKSAKLAQIGSGFIIGEQGIEYLHTSPKLDELITLLQTEITGQCIVYHNFVGVAHMIEERFRKEKIKFRAIRGEIKDKDKQIKDFQEDSTIKVLLAHPQSGGEGINLQGANVVIFFDQIYTGATLRKQCVGRVHRQGQTQRCVVIDLLIRDSLSKKGSIDERIYEVAKSKKELAEEILSYIRDA